MIYLCYKDIFTNNGKVEIKLKKTFSAVVGLILALTLAVSVSLPAFAEDSCGCGKTPVIMVSGFGATTLVQVNDDGSESVAFPFTVQTALSVVKKHISKFDVNNLMPFVQAVIGDLLEPIRMNPDGSSVHELKPIYSSAEDTSYAGFVKNNATNYIPYGDSDFLDMKSATARLGDDHVFNFLYDWRLSGDKVADLFLDYIEQVRSLTGHDKVSVYCLSQGSTAVAQYLYKYADKGYIDKLVFDNPIFEGSYFVSDILNDKSEIYNLDIDTLIDLLENIIHTEVDLSEILAAVIPDTVDPTVNSAVKAVGLSTILPIAKNSPAYLEMVPPDKFDQVCADYFSDEGNEKIIEDAMKVRNGYMKDTAGTLRRAAGFGAEISIVSCSGVGLVTGTNVQSDSIVNLSSSCGAYCSEGRNKFPDNYVQKEYSGGRNLISPDRTIDLSTGFIPERTWIINERYHGQGEWAPNSLRLLETLLYTSDLTDAWCSAEFPQFMQSDDPNKDVVATFASTNSLYAVQNGDGKLVVKNVATKNCVLITDISAEGAELTSESELPIKLAAGEQLVLTLDTSNKTSGKITIKYYESDNYCMEKTRTYSFSVTDNYSGQLTGSQANGAENSPLDKAVSKIWSVVSQLTRMFLSLVNNLISKIGK